ncbi:MAG: lamin tail domain-containing protein [Chloroflexi bacterium]|nr:lamin tail domain-containing protein [Chloroflexota bacterium]
MLLGYVACHPHQRPFVLPLVVAMLVAILTLAGPAQPAAAALACTTPNPGEVTVYWFDVEQGDAQLIVGPTGKTLLIDLGEIAWNSKGANTMAARTEAKIRSICGTGSNPVALDYVMGSHLHLDHIGYAWNPQDAPGAVGNGLYQLLTPTTSGGFGFTVGTLLDRDGGTWTDANGDGRCTVGTATSPDPEVAWSNAGTTSQTARRWICWLYGPAGQADRANIAGKVVTLTNSGPWPSIDLGTGVTATIINANGKDTMEVDGSTPVSGDHTSEATPPSENDYSVAVKVTYGLWEYATAGDSDGEYSTSGNGYTYNDVEAKIGPLFGNVETMRANHHGSDKSSSASYVNTLKPETTFISCGNNSYGHPGNRMLDALRSVVNERGTGADIYLANNPCDPFQSDGTTPTNYTGLLNTNGDVLLVTTGTGTGYVIYYGASSRTYAAYDEVAPDPSQVRINEFLMAPNPSGNGEWVELYNPTSSAIDISGLYIDDVAGGGGAPRQIPAGTTIAARSRWVMDIPSGFLNNTGAESVRYLKIVGGVDTVYDTYDYSLGSTQYNKVFHRTGDGGAWCNTISSNVTKGTANPTTCP